MACHERAGLGQRVEWTWHTLIGTALERSFNFRIYLYKTRENQRSGAKARQLRAKGLIKTSRPTLKLWTACFAPLTLSINARMACHT